MLTAPATCLRGLYAHEEIIHEEEVTAFSIETPEWANLRGVSSLKVHHVEDPPTITEVRTVLAPRGGDRFVLLERMVVAGAG